MRGALADLLRRPKAFFDRAASDPSLRGPLALALALGLLGVLRVLVFYEVLRGVGAVFGGGPLVYAVGRLEVSAPLELGVAAVLATGLFALGWLLITVVIYVVSRYFHDGGGFRDLLVLVGWGQIPSLVPAVLSTLFVVSVTLQAPEITTEAAARQWARTAMRGHPIRQLVALTKPLVAVWTGYLWLLGTERALGLSRRQALACVVLPAGLLLVNGLGSLVSMVV